MGLFGHNKDKPKDGLYLDGNESTEDPDVIEINRLYDSEQKFRRVGDKRAQIIMEHHRKEAIHKLYQRPGMNKVVAYDTHGDRWYLWPREKKG